MPLFVELCTFEVNFEGQFVFLSQRRRYFFTSCPVGRFAFVLAVSHTLPFTTSFCFSCNSVCGFGMVKYYLYLGKWEYPGSEFGLGLGRGKERELSPVNSYLIFELPL